MAKAKKEEVVTKPKFIFGDFEVAQFLADFRERATAEQEKSPIFQELVQFPGWGMAKYAPVPATIQAPPDPRLPPHLRQPAVGPPATESATGALPIPAAQSISTRTRNPEEPNPWSNTRTPPEGGPLFVGVRTDVAPPFPGSWRRTAEGWFREA